MVKIKLNMIKLDPSDILPYRTMEQQKEIEKKVEQFNKTGKFEPIRLYDDYRIIDGHLRFYAAKKLGLAEIEATIETRPK